MIAEVPSVDILPILLLLIGSVNHNAPSGPAAIKSANPLSVGNAYLVMDPVVVMRPMVGFGRVQNFS